MSDDTTRGKIKRRVPYATKITTHTSQRTATLTIQTSQRTAAALTIHTSQWTAALGMRVVAWYLRQTAGPLRSAS
jgi:hypothetical protein